MDLIGCWSVKNQVLEALETEPKMIRFDLEWLDPDLVAGEWMERMISAEEQRAWCFKCNERGHI